MAARRHITTVDAGGALIIRSVVVPTFEGPAEKRRLRIPNARFEDERHEQIHLVADDSIVLQVDSLLLDPCGFHPAQGLRGTLDTLLDGGLVAIHLTVVVHPRPAGRRENAAARRPMAAGPADRHTHA